MNSKRAVFVGAARNCSHHLRDVLPNLARLSRAYEEAAFVFAVSDSTDETAQVLNDWIKGRSGKVIDLGDLASEMPLRTLRIATARNACLAEINNGPLAAYDHLVMCDLDDVLTMPINPFDFRQAAQWLEAQLDRAGVFANATPNYYDIWALRHAAWCPGDCWHAIWDRGAGESFEAAKFREVYSRQFALPRKLPPIRVMSAFGGLGIYKLKYALSARYSGVDWVGREQAEHVSFNEAICKAGGLLHILPYLTVRAPEEHLFEPCSEKLRWRLKMCALRLQGKWRPPWRALFAT
jgi:hypothetical protein